MIAGENFEGANSKLFTDNAGEVVDTILDGAFSERSFEQSFNGGSLGSNSGFKDFLSESNELFVLCNEVSFELTSMM